MNSQQKTSLIYTPFSQPLMAARSRLDHIIEICCSIPESRKPKLQQALDEMFTRFGDASSDDVWVWIKKTRRETLNLFELAIGGEKNPLWPLVRNQLFSVFGPDGLEGKVEL